MKSLNGQVVLITGAAGGIGSSIAEQFVLAGAAVALLDRAGESLSQLETRLQALGGQVLAIPADITIASQVSSAVQKAVAHFGGLTTLVNAVGLLRQGRVDEMLESDWDDLMAVNVKGVFLACKYAVPAIKAAGGGSITNLSSVSAFVGSDGSFAYSASKGAVLSLTYGLAQELAPFGIRVNALCPGWVDAGFTHQALKVAPDPSVLLEQAKNAHLLGRMAAPSEIADAAVFLSSKAASFITGTSLNVDGGFMVKR
jgi:NAD(P)-dependent dehydrogenase (short-subunit alcohol dehydrogenase family)